MHGAIIDVICGYLEKDTLNTLRMLWGKSCSKDTASRDVAKMIGDELGRGRQKQSGAARLLFSLFCHGHAPCKVWQNELPASALWNGFGDLEKCLVELASKKNTVYVSREAVTTTRLDRDDDNLSHGDLLSKNVTYCDYAGFIFSEKYISQEDSNLQIYCAPLTVQ